MTTLSAVHLLSAMGALLWLLQWPIRALILLLVAWLPLGVEVESFGIGLLAAVAISLLSTLLTLPLRVLLSPAWVITSLGGLLTPISFLFGLLINIILFGLAAWLIQGFRLRKGLLSAVLGGLVYSVLCYFILMPFKLDVPLIKAMGDMLSGPIA